MELPEEVQLMTFCVDCIPRPDASSLCPDEEVAGGETKRSCTGFSSFCQTCSASPAQKKCNMCVYVCPRVQGRKELTRARALLRQEWKNGLGMPPRMSKMSKCQIRQSGLLPLSCHVRAVASDSQFTVLSEASQSLIFYLVPSRTRKAPRRLYSRREGRRPGRNAIIIPPLPRLFLPMSRVTDVCIFIPASTHFQTLGSR